MRNKMNPVIDRAAREEARSHDQPIALESYYGMRDDSVPYGSFNVTEHQRDSLLGWQTDLASHIANEHHHVGSDTAAKARTMAQSSLAEGSASALQYFNERAQIMSYAGGPPRIRLSTILGVEYDNLFENGYRNIGDCSSELATERLEQNVRSSSNVLPSTLAYLGLSGLNGNNVSNSDILPGYFATGIFLTSVYMMEEIGVCGWEDRRLRRVYRGHK